MRSLFFNIAVSVFPSSRICWWSCSSRLRVRVPRAPGRAGAEDPSLGWESRPNPTTSWTSSRRRRECTNSSIESSNSRGYDTHIHTSQVCSPENLNECIMNVSLCSGVILLRCGEHLGLWMERWVVVEAPREEGWASGTRPSRTRALFATIWGWRTAAAVPHWGKHKQTTW